MTSTVYYVAASIDGFIADAEGKLDWLFPFDGPEVAAHYGAFMKTVGAIVMGAATYEFLLGFEKNWPYPGIPTWVLTHRALGRFAGEGVDLRFTATDEVKQLHAEVVRAAEGKNVWMVGGGKVAAQFARHGLIDELHLGLTPVVLGAGAPLLPAAVQGRCELTGIERLGTKGLVELRYRLPKGA